MLKIEPLQALTVIVATATEVSSYFRCSFGSLHFLHGLKSVEHSITWYISILQSSILLTVA